MSADWFEPDCAPDAAPPHATRCTAHGWYRGPLCESCAYERRMVTLANHAERVISELRAAAVLRPADRAPVSRKTCVRGHPRTPENVSYHSGGKIRCKVCDRERARARARGERMKVQHRCCNGHDLSQPGAMVSHGGVRRCVQCKREREAKRREEHRKPEGEGRFCLDVKKSKAGKAGASSRWVTRPYLHAALANEKRRDDRQAEQAGREVIVRSEVLC